MNELESALKKSNAKDSRDYSSIKAFLKFLKFPLDEFQEKACRALADGAGVLVAAPTGSGKTIIGEFAIHLAIEKKMKAFYTTPIKALSNQKYAELVLRYGAERVGLLTGDTNQNSDAQILVMTTEVLRNMIYANSETLMNLGYVVMDEVHYLADRFRGAVWEEVILHLPKDVKVVSLSATVSNAEEFGAWLDEVRGDTQIIVSEIRPVPLNQHVLFGNEILRLFEDDGKAFRVSPDLIQKHAQKLRQPINRPQRGRKTNFYDDRRGRSQNRIERISKPAIVEILNDQDMLPAIFFVFSRIGCEASVKACLNNGIRLTTTEEKQEIRRIVEEKIHNIDDEDLRTLGYLEWLNSIERGVAAHHAGMLPAFKEVVEELFLKKLVRVVFATETLALGINMPARTVVLERLDKYNGEGWVQITPGEYTQLTGRAGRRGIDTEGHSLIQWSETMDPANVANLASKRTYPLISSFQPTYNMAVNLIEAFGRERAREVLETSFAQFQADRSVVGLAKGIREKQLSLDGYAKAMECHKGDFSVYARTRREISNLERALSSNRVRAERSKNTRQNKGRGHPQEQRLNQLKHDLKNHPCHTCHERETHARWGERWFQLQNELEVVLNKIEGRTNQVARTFDRICDMLEDMRYIQPLADLTGEYEVLNPGKTLARIHGERDLLIAEALREGLWKKLDAPSLAAMAAVLVYESRRDDESFEPRIPKGNFGDILDTTIDLWHELELLRNIHKLGRTNPLDLSLAHPIYRWASGAKLDAVLDGTGLLPGDFIRWAKQIIDVLDQITQTAEPELAAIARTSVDKVKRGIVAYSYYG